MIYPVSEEGELPEQIARLLWEYIEKFGCPPFPLQIEVDGEVVEIKEFSMEDTE